MQPLNVGRRWADNSAMSRNEAVVPSYIEKLLVPATVAVSGSEPYVGAFALCVHSPHRAGPESLLELLNSAARVVPFVRSGDDVVMLLARQAIEWVEIDHDIDPTWVRPRSYVDSREEQVHVQLLDGRRLEGKVTLDLPEHLNRISDFLNLPEDFFVLIRPRSILLLNKARLASARLFESSPRPLKRTGTDSR